MDGSVSPETKLNDANKIKDILTRLPDFDDKLIRNKCKRNKFIKYICIVPAFPINVRNEAKLGHSMEKLTYMRIHEIAN